MVKHWKEKAACDKLKIITSCSSAKRRSCKACFLLSKLACKMAFPRAWTDGITNPIRKTCQHSIIEQEADLKKMLRPP